MSSVRDRIKMFEQMGQEDKQMAEKAKLKQVSVPVMKKPYSYQYESEANQNHQTINKAKSTEEPKSQIQQLQQKQVFKKHLEQRLQFGSAGSGMNSEKNQTVVKNQSQNESEKGRVSQVSNESISFKNSRENLQNAFKQKQKKSEQQIKAIQQNQDQLAEKGEKIEEHITQNQQIPVYVDQNPSFLPKNETVSKSELVLRKQNKQGGKPTRNTHLGAFEDSD